MPSAAVIPDHRHLAVEVASGDALDVRRFTVEDRMSALFEIRLNVLADSPALDFDAIVGYPARFSLRTPAAERTWTGIISHIEQARAEERGASTYELTLVPAAWLLGQRRNHRMFQQITEPGIALRLLDEWNIAHEARIDRAAYKKRKYRVQYGESDLAFMSRMLEDAGVAYFFHQADGETRLVLSDAPHAAPPRAERLAFVDSPNPGVTPEAFVTALRVGQRVRPGRYTMRDRDYRLPPAYPLAASASAKGRGVEERLERFHYTPGAFLYGTERGDPTPSADDKGRARSDEPEAAVLAQKRLDAKRGSAKTCSFSTSAHDVAPGMVIAAFGHPHPLLAEGRPLLVVSSRMEGTADGEWTHTCEARATDVPYRPALTTPKPKVSGVESGTVVGPPGEEIHTDEFGRVRVHFHWDRESRMDDDSSCWIPVSQPWSGAAYGGINLPRVGQEVLVDFLGGDPDRPIIVGRVYTNLQKVPYRLPEHRTRSAWKSQSSPNGGDGYNEIMFEDLTGRELVFEQAERDRRRLVKHDEMLTVGNDRGKLVKGHEVETTNLTRTEVTGIHRTEITGADRTTIIGASRQTLVQESSAERVGGSAQETVGGSYDHVVGGSLRERVGGGMHVTVGGAHLTSVGGAHSLIVGGERHERVFGRYAAEVDEEIHFKGKKLVLEVAEDLTIKGPGGFLRINAEGVIIKGAVVKINSGGSPGSGAGVKAQVPDTAAAAAIEVPAAPVPDDVSRSRLEPLTAGPQAAQDRGLPDASRGGSGQ